MSSSSDFPEKSKERKRPDEKKSVDMSSSSDFPEKMEERKRLDGKKSVDMSSSSDFPEKSKERKRPDEKKSVDLSSSSDFPRKSKERKRRWARLLENYDGLPPPDPDVVPSDVLQRDYGEFGPDGITCLAEHWFVSSELARRLQNLFRFQVNVQEHLPRWRCCAELLQLSSAVADLQHDGGAGIDVERVGATVRSGQGAGVVRSAVAACGDERVSILLEFGQVSSPRASS